MNRIFGFFRQKLIQAKEQNKTQIQNIINAIQFETYSQTKMLNELQQIKTNYLQWNIMIANQASTGLYYTQIHNKTSILKKIRSNKQSIEKRDKYEIVLGQMRKTLKELHSIQKLNNQWTNTMNTRMHQLSELLARERQEQGQKIQQQQQAKAAQNNQVVISQPQAEVAKQQGRKQILKEQFSEDGPSLI